MKPECRTRFVLEEIEEVVASQAASPEALRQAAVEALAEAERYRQLAEAAIEHRPGALYIVCTGPKEGLKIFATTPEQEAALQEILKYVWKEHAWQSAIQQAQQQGVDACMRAVVEVFGREGAKKVVACARDFAEEAE